MKTPSEQEIEQAAVAAYGGSTSMETYRAGAFVKGVNWLLSLQSDPVSGDGEKKSKRIAIIGHGPMASLLAEKTFAAINQSHQPTPADAEEYRGKLAYELEKAEEKQGEADTWPESKFQIYRNDIAALQKEIAFLKANQLGPKAKELACDFMSECGIGLDHHLGYQNIRLVFDGWINKNGRCKYYFDESTSTQSAIHEPYKSIKGE